MSFSLKHSAVAIVAAAGVTLAAPAVLAQSLETDAEKLGYTIGMDIGNSLKQQGAEFDLDAMIAAVRAVMNNEETLLTTEEASAIRQAYIQQQTEQAEAERLAAGSENLEAGQAFLADNAARDGVVVTDSGLQYEVIEAGEGAKPAATDTVTVHYRGTLLDGREFDSSYSRGQPAQFPLNRVIPGWTEGVQLMSPGAKYRFYIPSDLAYGERGAGELIGPNATLIFDVELLDIAAAEQ
jgi:FKBP-type peptidyl-prolyl cis-trans isomerase